MREKGDKPKPEPKWAKESLVKGTLTERIRGDAQVWRVRRAHAGTILCGLLAQLQAREQDKFAAHSTGRAGNTDQPANGQARVEANRASHPSGHFRSPRAWDSRATFGSGSTCCGSAIEKSADIRPSRSHLDLW